MHARYLLLQGHKLGPLHDIGSPPPLAQVLPAVAADHDLGPLEHLHSSWCVCSLGHPPLGTPCQALLGGGSSREGNSKHAFVPPSHFPPRSASARGSGSPAWPGVPSPPPHLQPPCLSLSAHLGPLTPPRRLSSCPQASLRTWRRTSQSRGWPCSGPRCDPPCRRSCR